MVDITEHRPRTGQIILDNSSVVNLGDLVNAAFNGNRGLVVQPFTETNIKRGLQYYFRVAYPTSDPIAGATSRKLHYQIGSKPVLVKLRIFEYVGEEIQIELFASPTGVNGGTNIPVSNYNAVNPVPSTVTITKDVTTTDDGTRLDPSPEYFFGSSSAPQRDLSSIPDGRERVIPANSEFILKITNNNGQDARCQYFLDWYEGETDIS